MRSIRRLIRFVGCWLLMACLTVNFGYGQDARDDIAAGYAPGKVWAVHLKVSAEEWDAMQPRSAGGFFGFGPPQAAENLPPLDPKREVHRNNFNMNLPWASGSITLGEQVFENVGVRFKGNGTIMDASRTIKKSLKIDLDRRGGTGRFLGSKSINLHCGVTDPSKLRETMSYAIYRAAGVPAPRTALAEVRLSVPGKYDNALLGLYTLVEEVDKPFLKDRFNADKGALMKPEGLRDFEHRGDDWSFYDGVFKPKDKLKKDDQQRLIEFSKLVDRGSDEQFQSQIADYLDLDNYLRFLAASAVVVNADSFFVLGHNYYLYLHPQTRRLMFIPWDLDRALANFPILGSNAQQMDLSIERPYSGKHRLTERVLALPGLRERYLGLMRELSTTVLSKETLLKQLAEGEALSKDMLARDTEAAAARKDGVGGFGPPPGMADFGKPPPMREFIEKRSASIAAQLAGTSKGYVPGSNPFAMKIGDMLGPPLLESLDTNKDKFVAKAEWLTLSQRVFDACKADADGTVTEPELAAGITKLLPAPPNAGPGGPAPNGPPQNGPAPGGRGPGAGGPPGFGPGFMLAGPVMRRADADKNGKVTIVELKSAATKLFEEFDAQNLGQLDAERFASMLNALFPPPQAGPPGGAPRR